MIRLNNNTFAIQKDSDTYILFDAETHRIFLRRGNPNTDIPVSQLEQNLPVTIPDTQIRKPDQLASLTICMSERCNLRCKYCYANGGSYNHSVIEADMEADDLKTMFRELLVIYPRGIMNYTFFGGEPMLAFSTIKEFTAYVIEESEAQGLCKPHFAIVTNGTLISQDAWDFFNQMHVSVTVSLDGNQQENDAMRIFAGSDKSVYQTVARNLTTYGSRSFFLVAEASLSVDFFRRYSAGYISEYLRTFDELGFDCVSPFIAETPELDSDNPEIKNGITLFYQDLVDHSFTLLCSENHWGKTPTYILSVIVNILKKQSKRTCSAGKESLFYTKKGVFYPCQMYFGDVSQAIGCISDVRALKQTVMERKRRVRTEIHECQSCFARNFCTFWCPGGVFLFCGSEQTVDPVRCLAQKVIGERIIERIAQIYQSGNSELFISNLKKLSMQYSAKKYTEGRRYHEQSTAKSNSGH